MSGDFSRLRPVRPPAPEQPTQPTACHSLLAGASRVVTSGLALVVSYDEPVPAYLDHAATTPMSAAALAAMTAELAEVGNPSSLHAAGRRARKVVEQAREQIAYALGAQPVDVIFTSGGTEADNLAVLGLYRARRAADSARSHVIASAIEHHAVMDPVQALADREGATVHWLHVNRCGQVDLEHLAQLLQLHAERIALVAVMSANNEIGTRQPIAEVVAACKPYAIPVHCDAVQSVAWEPFNFRDSGLATAAITAHKVGGPHGIGALLLARGVAIEPVTFGGGQEAKLRSGTLDAPATAAFAVALTETVSTQTARGARVRSLREQLVAAVRESAPEAVLNGCDDCLPSVAHFSFPGCEGDALLMLLDAAGVQCSTGSACTAGIPEPSHVLLAMGRDRVTARGSLRFSLGATSTAADVDALRTALPAAVARARQAGQALAR